MRIIFIQLLLAAANQALGTGYSIAPALRHTACVSCRAVCYASNRIPYLPLPRHNQVNIIGQSLPLKSLTSESLNFCFLHAGPGQPALYLNLQGQPALFPHVGGVMMAYNVNPRGTAPGPACLTSCSGVSSSKGHPETWTRATCAPESGRPMRSVIAMTSNLAAHISSSQH